jgi:hypothetical protein
MYFVMKKYAYLILSVVIMSSSAFAEMTKEQAQKAVMKRYPAAKIVSCDQKTVNGKSMWMVKFTETGGNIAQTFAVDENGKLTRM